MRTRTVIGTSVLLLAAGCGPGDEVPTGPASQTPAAVSTATALHFRQVSAGTASTCGLTTDSLVYCWGLVPGNGAIQSLTPTLVAGTLRFRHVSVGNTFSCAVTTDYRAYCWGANHDGQLGNGKSGGWSYSPVAVGGSHRFRQVATGGFHSCGVSYPGNQIYCWGANFSGQLGVGTTTQTYLTPTPVVATLGWRQVTVGWEHTCAVTNGDRAYCWGKNDYGQLGANTWASHRDRPTPVAGMRLYKEISAGYQHTCAATTRGRAFCWGDGRNGQLGNGKNVVSIWPRLVAGDLYIVRLATGHWHSCGLTSQNRAYCWGPNFYGELGDGTGSPRRVPVPVAGGLEFTQLAGGEGHTCGVSAGKVLYCWGYNGDGELGDGTTGGSAVPKPVTGPT